MITLHLEASSLGELRLEACRALNLFMPGAASPPERPEDTEPMPAPQEPSVQSDKPRRAHRRVRPVEAPVATPVATPAPEPDPLEEAIYGLSGVHPAEGPDEPVDDDPEVVDAVQNEMLKRTVIASLADMFTAGNVKVVRHVLHKYGRGAKSFPEIDPAHFPEIKAALDRNEAA